MLWQYSLLSIPVSDHRLLPKRQHHQLAKRVMKMTF